MSVGANQSTGEGEGVSNPRNIPAPYVLPSELHPIAEVAQFALTHSQLAQSPLILLDKDALRQQVALWREHLPHVEPHFAVKVNDFAPLIELMRDEGMSFDAATGGEMDHIRSLGVSPEKVVVTHPIRDTIDIEAIKLYRPRALVVQDADEIRKLGEAGIPSKEYAPEIYVRIKLEFSNLNKFGLEGVFVPSQRPDGSTTWQIDHIPLVKLFSAARRIEREHGCRFSGYGFAGHVGTNSCSVKPYQMMLAGFRFLHERLAQHNIRITTFDIGGGYCDPEIAAEKGTTQAKLLSEIAVVTREAAAACPGVRLIAEPGRFMVSHCAALISSVKLSQQQNWRVTKDGAIEWINHQIIHMDDSVYGTLLGQAHDDKRWKFHALRLGDAAAPLAAKLIPTLIWGATCDSWDKISGDRMLPGGMKAGDYLIVPHVGAYATATKTSFNRAASQRIFFYERAPSGEVLWTLYDADGKELERPRGDLTGESMPRVPMQ